jgi:hypothetical protein
MLAEQMPENVLWINAKAAEALYCRRRAVNRNGYRKPSRPVTLLIHPGRVRGARLRPSPAVEAGIRQGKWRQPLHAGGLESGTRRRRHRHAGALRYRLKIR